MCYKHMETIVLNFLKTMTFPLNLNDISLSVYYHLKHISFFFKPYYAHLDIWNNLMEV